MPDEPIDSRESVELVRAAQSGDRRAYDELFERFYRRVLTVVRARLGPHVRESLESGDVAHEAMVQAIRSFDRFEIHDADGLIRWFAQIVENRIRAAVDFHRAARRDRSREVALLHSPETSPGTRAIELPDGAPSPQSTIERAEQVGRLQECLGDLDPRSRELLRMRSESMPWGVIAERLGATSADAARMLYARVLVKLKKAMEAPPPRPKAPGRVGETGSRARSSVIGPVGDLERGADLHRKDPDA